MIGTGFDGLLDRLRAEAPKQKDKAWLVNTLLSMRTEHRQWQQFSQESLETLAEYLVVVEPGDVRKIISKGDKSTFIALILTGRVGIFSKALKGAAQKM